MATIRGFFFTHGFFFTVFIYLFFILPHIKLCHLKKNKKQKRGKTNSKKHQQSSPLSWEEQTTTTNFIFNLKFHLINSISNP